eukprot:1929388-Pyramimonas_sp.AAC.1
MASGRCPAPLRVLFPNHPVVLGPRFEGAPPKAPREGYHMRLPHPVQRFVGLPHASAIPSTALRGPIGSST